MSLLCKSFPNTKARTVLHIFLVICKIQISLLHVCTRAYEMNCLHSCSVFLPVLFSSLGYLYFISLCHNLRFEIRRFPFQSIVLTFLTAPQNFEEAVSKQMLGYKEAVGEYRER